jgi:hypothetical protein
LPKENAQQSEGNMMTSFRSAVECRPRLDSFDVNTAL